MNEQVIAALMHALKTKPNHGICQILTDLGFDDMSDYYALMIKCCEALGVYSGNPSVPISVAYGEPYMLFRNAKRKKKMWNSKSRYGNARRAVAAMMIEELKHD